jgi:hypothetical protein
MSPDIDNLNLQSDEILGEINWDAPERGTFSPKLEPGSTHLFTFELEDEPWLEREYDHKPIKGIHFKATTAYTDASGEEKETTLRFQQAEFFKTQKMVEKRVNSDAEELMRSLNLKLDRMTWDNIKQAFKEADGRAKFTATVGLRAYSKDDKISYRTHPRGKNDLPWPKGADGKYAQTVTFPSGEVATGREELAIYRLPRHS